MAIRQAEVPFIRGYDFGVGADLMSGSPMSEVVNDTHTGVADAHGANVQFRVRRIQTTSDLDQSLGLDVDASFGSAMFGAGVKERLAFVKSAGIQASSLFMTVTVQVTLEFLSIDAPVLTTDAASIADRPDVFDSRFGNMFVRGISRGGLFIGILRIETESTQDAESISNELSGTYGLFSADVKVKFANTIKKFRGSLFVTMYHEGGPTDLQIQDPADPAELLKCANDFLTSFQTRPADVAVPYSVTLAPITIAKGPLPLNAEQILHSQDVLTFCAKRRSVGLDQLNLLQFISDNPNRFDFSQSASLQVIQEAEAASQEDLDLISACASSAINSPANAKMPADFAIGIGQVFPRTKMPQILPTLQPLPIDFDGVWENVLTNPDGSVRGSTTWTMTRIGPNRYDATEQGGGNAVGTATRTDLTVHLDWRATNPGDTNHGTYDWTLNPSVTTATGTARGADGVPVGSSMVRRS